MGEPCVCLFDVIHRIVVKMLICIFLAARACSDADKIAKHVIISNGVIVLAMNDYSREMGAGIGALVWHDFSYFCGHTISYRIGAQSCATLQLRWNARFGNTRD